MFLEEPVKDNNFISGEKRQKGHFYQYKKVASQLSAIFYTPGSGSSKSN
jgi:hypothetical protein